MKSLLLPVILIIMLLSNVDLLAQTFCNLKGRVVDKINREPIESVVILDEATGNTDYTDKNGCFTLKVVNGDSVCALLIGYKPFKVKADIDNQMVIALERGAISLKDVTISNSNTLKTNKALSLLDLNMQPAKSAQDLLRLVPGLFIAQHQGGGKAEQIFLRGFDADHGTDVNISVDGMPVNMVTHAHGQGYADLHFLIPETVSGYDFGKGPYYSDKGDFTTAGYVAYTTKNVPDQNMFKIELGQFNTMRLMAMVNLLSEKARKKGASAYIAGERLYSDGGPFALPEHFTRYNLFGKFSKTLSDKTKLTASISTLSSGWRSAGELPDRAVSEGYIANRFGVLDTAQGGYTTRTNANLKLTTNLTNGWTLDNQFWYSHYFFNLISNFTYYYYFPKKGDEFRQRDNRDVSGYNSKIAKTASVGDAAFTTTIGGGFRYDNIYPSELDHTANGQFLGYLQYGKARELNINSYIDETIHKGRWLFNAGTRLDYFHFFYQNLAPQADTFATGVFTGLNPNAQKAIISPKLSAEYTFNDQFQLYTKAGKGFHSNDARVVIGNQGFETLPAAYGADLGANWKPIPNLYINAALWYLYLQQEFTFGQDLVNQPGGPVTPSGKTVRTGIDFSARYQITKWLYANMNWNLAHPRFADSAAGHNYVPLAPTLTNTAALNFRFENGINGGISYRYLHDRAANSDYSLTARGYFITDLALNYTCKRYEVGIAVENLFNQQWDESQFEYTSRLYKETAPVDQVSYTPGVPFFAKLKLAVFF